MSGGREGVTQTKKKGTRKTSFKVNDNISTLKQTTFHDQPKYKHTQRTDNSNHGHMEAFLQTYAAWRPQKYDKLAAEKKQKKSRTDLQKILS